MAYMPAPSLSTSNATDSAGGVVSRTLDAAGVAYSQAAENKERSSLVDMLQALRAAFQQMHGKRGGGHRRLSTISSLGVTGGLTFASTTIAAAGAVYDSTNENTYRGNLAGAINALITDINASGFTSGRRPSVTRITDSSGGSAGSIGAAGGVYTQAGENNTRATFAAKLNEIADALGV